MFESEGASLKLHGSFQARNIETRHLNKCVFCQVSTALSAFSGWWTSVTKNGQPGLGGLPAQRTSFAPLFFGYAITYGRRTADLPNIAWALNDPAKAVQEVSHLPKRLRSRSLFLSCSARHWLMSSCRCGVSAVDTQS